MAPLQTIDPKTILYERQFRDFPVPTIKPGKVDGLHGAVGSASYCRLRGRKFESLFGHITVVEIDYEIISKVIFP